MSNTSKKVQFACWIGNEIANLALTLIRERGNDDETNQQKPYGSIAEYLTVLIIKDLTQRGLL